MHDVTTHVLSAVMIVIGVLMLVRTIILNGGVFDLGIILGILFIAAGAGRIYVQRKIR